MLRDGYEIDVDESPVIPGSKFTKYTVTITPQLDELRIDALAFLATDLLDNRDKADDDNRFGLSLCYEEKWHEVRAEIDARAVHERLARVV